MSRLRDLSITIKFYIAFGAVCLLCAGLGAVSLAGFSRVNRSLDSFVSGTVPSVEVLGEIRYAASTIRRTDLLLLVCPTTECSAHYADKRGKYLTLYKQEMAAYEPLIGDPREREIYEKMRPNLDAYVELSEKARALAERGNTSQAINLLISDQAQKTYNTGADLAEEDAALNRDTGATAGRLAIASSRNLMILLGFVIALTLVLCVVVGLAMSREIATPLKAITEALERVASKDLTGSVEVKSGDEIGRLAGALNTSVGAMRDVLQLMSQGSGTISAAARELSERSHRNKDNSEAQTGKINEIARAALLMGMTIADISQSVQSAAKASQQSADSADKGSTVMRTAAETMEMIAGDAGNVEEKINSLVERSKEIGEVALMIQEISEQTHMLAFNAAIEAARAGEHGTGFVVVANHVRRLAESTKAATGEITSTICSIQRETNETLEAIAASRATVAAGLNETAEARDSLQAVISSSQEMGMKMEKIASSATEQTATSTEIFESAQHMSQLANENSQATNEIAQAAGKLSDLAHQLDGIIGQFKISSRESAVAR